MNRLKRVASGLVGLACAGLIFVGCNESSAAPTESTETAIPPFASRQILQGVVVRERTVWL